MSLTHCKIELKLKWTNYCVLIAAGPDNANPKSNNIIFIITDTRSCCNFNSKRESKTLKASK